MAAAGYDTAAFVSNMNLQKRVGLGRGFAHYDDRMDAHEANRQRVRERVARDATAAATAWLKKERERPFFLWVHYQDPHGPYMAPGRWRGKMQGSRGGSADPLPRVENNFGEGGVPGYQVLPDAQTLDEYHGRYLEETAYSDEEIGKLLQAARAAAGRELLVVFTSDHGESFGEESFYFVHGHTGMPDLAHVPLVIQGADLDPWRWTAPVSHVDLLPTVLGLLDIAGPPALDGRDLSDAMRARKESRPAVVFCDVGYETVAYRGAQILRLRGPERTVKTDAFYKGGRADRLGKVMRLSDVKSKERYHWVGQGSRVEPGAEAWGLEAYFAGSGVVGTGVSWTADELEELRQLGYMGTD
jgi:arylsulfatase A-like enzyme